MNISEKTFSYSGPLNIVVEIDEAGRHIDDGLVIGHRHHSERYKATEAAAQLIAEGNDNKVVLVRLDVGLTFVSIWERKAGMYAEVAAWGREGDCEKVAMDDAKPLRGFVEEKFKTQAAFAKAIGVEPAQVTQWMAKDFIVVKGVLYSPRRKLGE